MIQLANEFVEIALWLSLICTVGNRGQNVWALSGLFRQGCSSMIHRDSGRDEHTPQMVYRITFLPQQSNY